MTPTTNTRGRLAAIGLSLAAGPGCACLSEQHATLIHWRVSDGVVRAGLNPHLRVGMPLCDATAYLQSSGFRQVCRENPPSGSLAGEGAALHFVRVLPHPAPFVVTHPEVHVRILHDGNHVTDIKSEKITTTVD